MARKNNRIYTILGAAIGTGLAVYGIRQGIRWYQQRQSMPLLPESTQPAERRYQRIDQPDREPIPATGPLPAAPPVAGMTSAQRANPDMVSDFDDRGTAFTASQLILDDYVAPLIEHAIAFNSVINLLRSRQRSGEGFEGTESLSPSDRSSMQAVLDQMSEGIQEYNEAALRQNKLAMRSHNLTRKLREAINNAEHTGSDLFRIYGEVQTELCSLANDLDKSGQVKITGLDQIRQLYECAK